MASHSPTRALIPAESPHRCDAGAEDRIDRQRNTVGQHEDDRHDDQGLQDETQPGKPQFSAVPPAQEPSHAITLCLDRDREVSWVDR